MQPGREGCIVGDVDESLGLRFWLWLGGVFLLGAVALFAFFLLLGHTFYVWGAFGGLAVLIGVLLVIAWFYDRRQKRAYESAG